MSSQSITVQDKQIPVDFCRSPLPFTKCAVIMGIVISCFALAASILGILSFVGVAVGPMGGLGVFGGLTGIVSLAILSGLMLLSVLLMCHSKKVEKEIYKEILKALNTKTEQDEFLTPAVQKLAQLDKGVVARYSMMGHGSACLLIKKANGDLRLELYNQPLIEDRLTWRKHRLKAKGYPEFLAYGPGRLDDDEEGLGLRKQPTNYLLDRTKVGAFVHYLFPI